MSINYSFILDVINPAKCKFMPSKLVKLNNILYINTKSLAEINKIQGCIVQTIKIVEELLW